MGEIEVCFSVDVDAVCGWLGSYGGEDSPSDIQRGVFAGEVGVPRLLKLFERAGIKTTWFIPGHSIETFPDETAAVHAAGHEIAAHGYSHENPVAMSRTQEETVLLRCVDLIKEVTGRAPRGYNAPWWEMSENTAELLLSNGFLYDHSQMYNDHDLDYARAGDSWTKIDYSQPASAWMKPMVRGRRIDLVEISSNWYLDDLPPMMFIKTSPETFGFVDPRVVESIWRDEFEWVHREMDSAVFPITIHPDVSGHPQVLLMLERFIDFVNGHDRVVWKTMEDIAAGFRARKPFSSISLAGSL